MVRKLERRRVRGALDRFGPPLESASIKILDDADDEAPAHPQTRLQVKGSYMKVTDRDVHGSLTAARVRPVSPT